MTPFSCSYSHGSDIPEKLSQKLSGGSFLLFESGVCDKCTNSKFWKLLGWVPWVCNVSLIFLQILWVLNNLKIKNITLFWITKDYTWTLKIKIENQLTRSMNWNIRVSSFKDLVNALHIYSTFKICPGFTIFFSNNFR